MSENYDVIVVGGGAAGVGAAAGASLAGARTALLERGPCLGGAATLRNVTTYCGLYSCSDHPEQVVFGVAERVLAGLRAEGAVSEPVRSNAVYVNVDPEAVKRTLDTVCEDAGVEILLHTTVVAAHRDADAGRITRVTVADPGGLREMTASAFVDTSGDAALTAFAGAATRYGSDGRAMTGTLGVRFGGVAPDADTTHESVRAAVTKALADGVGPLTSATGLVTRIPPSDDVVVYLADEDYDVRDTRSLTRAEIHARRQALVYLGVLRALPGWGQAYIASTGPELGTRESRHVVTRRKLDRSHVLEGRRDPDAVAVGAWPVEYHPGAGLPSIWKYIADGGTYDIPLDTLASASTTNLFAAGRLLDGDRGAAASLRVMGTSFGTGQAAGVAAARTAAHPATPASVHEVRNELQSQDARLPDHHLAPTH
ncbi:MAG: hypothetical protein QOI76_3203 [Frankiales bacterium]|nr:hypothetical protein [Frankiales bacterium]